MRDWLWWSHSVPVWPPFRRWRSPPSPVLQSLLALDRLAPTQPASHARLLQQLQLKLAANCCINPLTAVLGCLNGGLLEQEHTRWADDASSTRALRSSRVPGARRTGLPAPQLLCNCKRAGVITPNHRNGTQESNPRIGIAVLLCPPPCE